MTACSAGNDTAASSSGTPSLGKPAARERPIVPRATNEAWMKQARQALANTDPQPSACLDTPLDQTMPDAVAI